MAQKAAKDMSIFAVLKNKNFLRIWLIQIFSLTTAHMLNFVLIDRIFIKTSSTAAVGLFFALYYLPSVLLGPFVGVLIDRWQKKQILIFSNFFQAIIVLFYLGLGDKVWPIYTIVLLYSLCDEFFNPAIGASLPAIVKKKFLPVANGFFFLTTQSALALGYLVGGLMLRFLKNHQPVFLFASLVLFLAAVVAAGISRRRLEKRKKTKFNLAKFQEQLVEGYNFIKNEPRVLFPLLLLTGLQVLLGMAIILLPSISQQILSISFADSSFVLIAPAFLGAALANLLIEKLTQDYRKKNLITIGLFLTSFLIFLFALALPGLKWPLVLAIFLALGLGTSFSLVFIPSLTLVQEHTPFDIRGRVFATLSTLVTLAAAVPMLMTATLVDLLGIDLVLLSVALIILFLGFYAQRGKYGLLGINHWS